MRLTWKNANWKRVAFIYAAYVVLILVTMMMPWMIFAVTLNDMPSWHIYRVVADTPLLIWHIVTLVTELIVTWITMSCLLRLKPTPRPKMEPHIYDHVGLIIPCHKSASVIQDTLVRALKHFKPEHIVVMDNGKSETPLDDCLLKIREIFDRIIYRWVPIGNKATALLMGSRLLPNPAVTHILLMDDDVLIPETFEIDTSYFDDDDDVSAIAYSIGGCGHDNTTETMNIIQRFQDLEFKLWDTKRIFFGQYTSILFAHGAIGLWRRDRFTEIYEIHPGLPIGEDGWAGRLNLLHGYSMKQDSGPLFRTEVPPNLYPPTWNGPFRKVKRWMKKLWNQIILLKKKKKRQQKVVGASGAAAVVAGYGSPDLFNQRAMRWNMNPPRRVWCHLKLVCLYGWNRFRDRPFMEALRFNIMFRLSLMGRLWSIYKSTLVVLIWIKEYSTQSSSRTLGTSGLIVLLGVSYLSSIVKTYFIMYNVWRNRKDLQIQQGKVVSTILLMPLYVQVQALYRLYGWWRSVLQYIPLVPTPPHVLGQREDLNRVWPMIQHQTDQDVLQGIPSQVPGNNNHDDDDHKSINNNSSIGYSSEDNACSDDEEWQYHHSASSSSYNNKGYFDTDDSDDDDEKQQQQQQQQQSTTVMVHHHDPDDKEGQQFMTKHKFVKPMSSLDNGDDDDEEEEQQSYS